MCRLKKIFACRHKYRLKVYKEGRYTFDHISLTVPISSNVKITTNSVAYETEIMCNRYYWLCRKQ